MAAIADLDSALDPIREGVEADGARLRVTGRHDDVLDVVLEQSPDACQRCILPTSELESMAADIVRELDPTIQSVEVTVVGST